jgi:hypothetical protein
LKKFLIVHLVGDAVTNNLILYSSARPACTVLKKWRNPPLPVPDTEHFEIDASVVFQLGASLITDATQALMELVKNSYGADPSD